jgi:SP family arabinose:H+ symporter-like MFS transporter
MSGSTRYVYLISIVAALGGLLFGYDTAVISGAIGSIKTKFDLSPALEGWAASSAIWGCVVGVSAAGYLADRFGRKRVLLASAVLFAVSAIGSAIPQSLTQFVAARWIGGLGVGAASMISPLYISEVAPADKRGRLGTLYQLAIVIGINLVYFINYKISGWGSEAWNVDVGWRYMLGSEVIPALLFFFLIFLVPESPRWLMKRERESEALDVLKRVNGPERAIEVQSEIRESLNQKVGRFRDLFKPGLRKALMVGVVLAVFQQITGINAIIYYAPQILKSVGFGTESAMAQTFLIGVINTVFTFVAIWLIDKAGRRTLLLWGVSSMIICLFGAGAAFHFELTSGPWLLLFILGFIASFACSLGPIPWIMISEIFPTATRGQAMSLSIMTLWLAVVAITQFTPMLLDPQTGIGGAYTFWLFMINAVILLGFVWKFVPETKQRTLEEIAQSWSA